LHFANDDCGSVGALLRMSTSKLATRRRYEQGIQRTDNRI
jgi:hypothetical protein